MSNNDFQREAAARLRSLAKALNDPISEVESMSDEQVRAYLAQNGHDTADLRDALADRIAKMRARRAELADVETEPVKPTEQGSSEDRLPGDLRGRLKEIDMKIRPFATAINIPFGTASELVRGNLYALPDKLIARVAAVCQMDLDDASFMLGRIPASKPQAAMLLRRKGDNGLLPVERRSFREVMLLCKESGELPPPMEEDWKEELIP